MMSYILMDKPLTRKQCKTHETQYVCGVVPIPLQSVIDSNFEEFLDILEYATIGPIGTITDLEYDVVGNDKNDTLHIRVTGYADLVGDD